MHEGRGHRPQQPQSGGDHADDVDHHRAHEVHHDDAPGPAGHPHGLDQVGRGGSHEHHVPGLAGHVRAGAHGDADVGGAQGGRVVDAVTHHGHPLARPAQRVDDLLLVGGQQVGAHLLLGQAEQTGHVARGGGRVAGEHEDLQAHVTQVAHGSGRSLTQPVGQGDGAQELFIGPHLHHRGGRRRLRVGLGAQGGLILAAGGVPLCSALLPPAASHGDPASFDVGAHAGSGGVGDVAGYRHRQVAYGGLVVDGPADGVLGVPLRRGRQGQHLVLPGGGLGGADAHDPGLADGEGTGLVHHHRVHRGELLQVGAVLDEGPATGGAGDGRQNRQGSARGHPAGPGHDDDRDRGAHVPGDQAGDQGGRQGQVDDAGRQPVGQALDRRARGLGVAHRGHDPPVGGVLADPLHLELQGAAGDGTCRHPVTRPDLHGQRLPGDPGLVDVSPTGAHDAVDRHPAPGTQGDDLPRAHLIQRDLSDPGGLRGLGGLSGLRGPHHPCGLRQEGHEICQGVAAPVHRQLLEDLGAQREDGHGQGGHPLADDGGSHDGQEHRQLHTHAALAQVFGCLDQERPAAHRQHHRPDGAHRPAGRAGRPRDPGTQCRQAHHRDAHDVGPLDPLEDPLARAGT